MKVPPKLAYKVYLRRSLSWPGMSTSAFLGALEAINHEWVLISMGGIRLKDDLDTCPITAVCDWLGLGNWAIGEVNRAGEALALTDSSLGRLEGASDNRFVGDKATMTRMISLRDDLLRACGLEDFKACDVARA